MSVMLEISLVPSGKDGAGLSKVVAAAVDTAKKHGVRYMIGPMGTTLEGDLDALLKVVREMHEMPFRMGFPRSQTIIKIDDRRDKDLTMDYKVSAVEEKLR